MTKVCYLYLPRPQFMNLQKRIFPLYFAAETALVLVTVVTYPASSVLGLLSEPIDLGLLGVSLAMSGLNYLVYGPRTLQAMLKRTDTGKKEPDLSRDCSASAKADRVLYPESRDGLHPGTSASMAKEKVSEDLYKLKRLFSVNHAMSIHFNLIGVISTLIYGISLSSRLTG